MVALGANYDIAATPGLAEGGNEFYSLHGAERLRDVLPSFSKGRVIVGVTSAPFKCPPAPSEAALLMHDYLVNRGIRNDCERSLVMPFGMRIPPSPDTSRALLAAFAERNINFIGKKSVNSIDAARHTAVLDDGTEMPFELFLGVPKHRAPAVVEQSLMTVNGWIPVDKWPATPFAISPGQSLDFSVIHTPATGSQPGPRSAMLLLITNTNDTLIATINGEATTRTIAVAPATLFDDVTILVGKLARQTVIITNSGTATMKLGATTITGPTSTDYTLGRLLRTTLGPGQSEFLEVTYRPLNQGTSSATLTVNTNATNGAQAVQLGGTATRIQPGTGEANATSSVDATLGANGTTLWQTAPNPGRDIVKLAYRIAQAGDVSVKLYNEQGKEVMTLEEGTRDAGDHSVSFSVRGLSSGTYHYRLVANGQTVARSMVVAK